METVKVVYHIVKERNWHCLEITLDGRVTTATLSLAIATDLKKQGFFNLGYAAYAKGRRLQKSECINDIDVIFLKFARDGDHLRRDKRKKCHSSVPKTPIPDPLHSVELWQKSLSTQVCHAKIDPNIPLDCDTGAFIFSSPEPQIEHGLVASK